MNNNRKSQQFLYLSEFKNYQQMSDDDQSNVNSQQEEQDQQNSNQQQQQDADQDDDQDQDEDQDNDQDDDQDQDQDQDDQQNSDQQQQEEQSKDQPSQDGKKLPTFNIIHKEPQQFKFTSLLSQISNLSNSVDNFIGSLSSSNSVSYKSRSYQSSFPLKQTYVPVAQVRIPQASRVIMMKDQDCQVDMKPQIIIQPTKTISQQPVIQARPYKVSNESEKFLAQLYQQNKKLKRFQNTSIAPMNSYTTALSQSFGNTKNSNYGQRDKFERKQYEKGLFNVDDRNKEIDQAIHMLRRQQDNDYIPYQ